MRGRVLTVETPAGFASLQVQVLTSALKGKAAPGRKAAAPEWKTVASRIVHGEAGVIRLTLPRLTARRAVRVYGVMPEVLPSKFLTGSSIFPPDPGDGSTLSNTGVSSSNLASANSADSLSGASLSSGSTALRTVSESDIWKVDGERLYFYNSSRGLQVFDVSNPDDPGLLGTLRLPGAGEEMYLLDSDHVVLLKNKGFSWWWIDWDYRWDWFGGPVFALQLQAAPPIATLTPSVSSASLHVTTSPYGGDSLLRTTSQPHEVIVADVSAGAPRVLAAVPFDGYLQESRLIGSVLYLATNSYGAGDANGLTEWGCRVTSFDLSNPAAPVQRASVFLGGWSSAVYATDQYFFVAGWGADGANVQVLDISDPTGAILAAGAVTVPGSVQDKFKIHQDGETLTVVSANWHEQTYLPYTQVSTFSLANPLQPAALGTLTVADGEELYGTRFDAKRLYVVTAVQQTWDPLSIVDLTDPAALKILGSVDVPGFSTYIAPLGNQLVTTGLVRGKPTVSLYDVTDAAKPKLLSSVSLGTAESWTSSEAVWDEKAFNVLPDQNLILMPVSDYDSAGGYAGGVQLIDLLPAKLAKRGVIQHGFYPRRATVYGNRILSVSSTKLVTVNASDRDHPAVTSDLEIAWPVDRTFLSGAYLLELGGDTWGATTPTLTVTPSAAPDESLATLELPALPIQAATLRNGVLYVLQSGAVTRRADNADAGTFTLSTIDVSHLPAVKLLAQVGGGKTRGYFSRLDPLWVNDRTLIFAAQSSRSWSWYPWWPVDDTVASTDVTLHAKSAALSSIAIVNYRAWGWSRSRDLFAFDVTAPTQPKFASQLSFGATENWDVAVPLAAKDTVYLGYKVCPAPSYRQKPWPVLDDAAASDAATVAGLDPTNRYFLKLIDYSDSAAPVVADGSVNLPGELRGLSRNGALLYTVGPMLALTNGQVNGSPASLQVSGFDGAKVHLLDQLSLQARTQPFVLAEESLLLLQPQPATIWGTNSYQNNPEKSVLESYTVTDEGNFGKRQTLALEHELSMTRVNDLAVLRSRDASIHLLDLRDPANLLDLGTFELEGYGWSSLETAVGDAQRGLWLPLGEFGVQTVALP